MLVQYGYIVVLFHVHGDSIVRSRKPVVVPVQCPTKNHEHPLSLIHI